MRRFIPVVLLILTFSDNIFSQVLNEKPFDTCIDVVSYHLELDLIDAFTKRNNRSFEGEEIISLAVKHLPEDGNIWLNASKNSINIKKVSGPLQISERDGDKVRFLLDKSVKEGDTIVFSLKYAHTGVIDEGLFVSPGSVFTNNAPIEARDWFICKDHPGDKAFFSAKISVPTKITVGAVGLLENVSDSAGIKKWYWKSRYPMSTYLMVFSASSDYKTEKFSVTSKLTGNEIPVELYWRKGEDKERVDYIIKAMPYLLDFFEARFGKYPFEKIAFATLTPDFPYGGMENQSFITLCAGCWDELLIVHEFSHQWFGDLVSPKSWKDLWLNEGFAEYMEAHWVEVWTPKEKNYYKSIIEDYANYYFIINPKEAISEKSWDYNTPPGGELYNPALVYKKAACVIHMLRQELGDSTFFHLLKRFMSEPSFMYANASTEDFVKLTNEVSGRDYSWFFHQWLDFPGHPVYANRTRLFTENGSDWLEITLIQKDWERVYYKTNFELLVEYEDGRKETFKGFNKENGETFRFKTGKGAKSVIFDPDDKIILKKEE